MLKTGYSYYLLCGADRHWLILPQACKLMLNGFRSRWKESVGPWLTAFAYGTSYFSAVVSLDTQASLAGNTALPQPGLVSATRLLVHSLHGSYLAEEQEL